MLHAQNCPSGCQSQLWLQAAGLPGKNINAQQPGRLDGPGQGKQRAACAREEQLAPPGRAAWVAAVAGTPGVPHERSRTRASRLLSTLLPRKTQGHLSSPSQTHQLFLQASLQARRDLRILLNTTSSTQHPSGLYPLVGVRTGVRIHLPSTLRVCVYTYLI